MPRKFSSLDFTGKGDTNNPSRSSTTDLIRAECPQRTDGEFAAGLAPFLRALVARPRMFATEWFRERCEATARGNVDRLLEEWRRAGHLPRGA